MNKKEIENQWLCCDRSSPEASGEPSTVHQ